MRISAAEFFSSASMTELRPCSFPMRLSFPTETDESLDIGSTVKLTSRLAMKSDAADRMRLLFVGDVMLGRMVNDLLRRVDADYPWGDTRTQLQAADWRACNLECVISDRGRPWSRTPKEFHFRSDAKNVAVLRAAGIDAVSLANNHALDFGYDAMLDMLKLLDRAGIQHAGAGTNPAEAVRPGVAVVKGTSIGLIAFTDNEPEWEAGPQSPGLFYLPIDVSDERAGRLFETVHAVDEVDRNDESFIFMLEMDGARMTRMTLRPTVITGCQARMAQGERARVIALKMTRLCERLGTRSRWLDARTTLEIPGV